MMLSTLIFDFDFLFNILKKSFAGTSSFLGEGLFVEMLFIVKISFFLIF